MRIWDRIPPTALCRQHLLGEHRELHGLFNILAMGKKGYSRHPETLRWVDHLPALVNRHEELVIEMADRGYQHNSPLGCTAGVIGSVDLPEPLDNQREALVAKGCECFKVIEMEVI